MLKVLEREIVRKKYFFGRIATSFRRGKAFPTMEAAGVDLEGDHANSDQLRSDVGVYTDASKTLTLYESSNSMGSFITDVDGSTFLDLCSMENLPLGYNHSAFVAVANDKNWDIHSINAGLDAAERATSDSVEQARTLL